MHIIFSRERRRVCTSLVNYIYFLWVCCCSGCETRHETRRYVREECKREKQSDTFKAKTQTQRQQLTYLIIKVKKVNFKHNALLLLKEVK